VYRFDCVLIDPTPEALSQTLGNAAAAANKGCRARLLHWPVSDFADFVTAWRTEREGQRQWTGPRADRQRADIRSAVAVLWWDDPLGRKHCRVIADRDYFGNSPEGVLLNPEYDPYEKTGKRPLLWRIHPDDLCLRQNGKTWRLWATCRCGAAGPPEKLGWMGPWCAACHDRAEEGAPLSRPDVRPPVVFSDQSFWVADLAFALGGQILLTRVKCKSTVHLWDTASGEVRTRKFPGDRSQALAVSADGKTAAVCVDQTVHVWSLLDDSCCLVLPLAVEDPIQVNVALAFSPDGSSLAWAGGGYHTAQIALHTLPTGRLCWSVPVENAEFLDDRHYLSFSPDGRTIALGQRDKPVQVWAAKDGRKLRSLRGGAGSGSAVVYAPDGKTLAVGDYFWGENYLRLWDVASGKTKASLDGPVTGLAFSPDSRLLAVSGRDGRLRLLEPSGRLLGTFRWHQGDIEAVAFSPDGRWLATGGDDNRVKLWPIEGLLGSRAPRLARPRRKRT
jgi:WD40 repeat protein